jgi:hypothetical protein
VGAQIVGAFAGVIAAHLMFGAPLLGVDEGALRMARTRWRLGPMVEAVGRQREWVPARPGLPVLCARRSRFPLIVADELTVGFSTSSWVTRLSNEEVDRLPVQPGEVVKLDHVDPPFSRFALWDEGLRLAERGSGLSLSESGL